MYQLKLIRVGDSDPRVVLLKAIHRGDSATGDMFNTQHSLFRSEEHTSNSSHGTTSRMTSSD